MSSLFWNCLTGNPTLTIKPLNPERPPASIESHSPRQPLVQLKQFNGKVIFTVAAIAWMALAARAENLQTIEVAAKPGEAWSERPVRTFASLPESVQQGAVDPRDKFGGWTRFSLPATGYFYVTNFQNRWWFVDPVGGLFLQAGVASVRKIPTAGAAAALTNRFDHEDGWSTETANLLHENGFNVLGAWSDSEAFETVTNRLPYTRLWNFMSSYGKKRGGTFQQPGHTGYPNDCIFVFDPEFEIFCDEYARQLAGGKNDPWLLGNFSDNELPFSREALKKYLELPVTDAGSRAAWAWLRQKHGDHATLKDVTPQDNADFLVVVATRYFEIVSHAIKKYDPQHLFLGSRFYAVDIAKPELFRACGPFVDVVSLNYYRAWTPDAATVRTWFLESGRPVLITEWYAKGADSGMANTGGAGWLLKTQRDRGLFYENFTLALLEIPSCVGWQWFRYADNDPEAKGVDPSNRDSNKGIVSSRYEPYVALLESMKTINQRIYSLAEHFVPTAASEKTSGKTD